jgi:DNA-binding MarR family transcriptional regulator
MSIGPRDPERSFGFLLHDVSRLLRANFNRRASAHGLTQAQWRTLAHLSRREGVNQVTLAEALDIQPITLARLIDRMEANGWVLRRPDPNDRRAFRLYLTEKAQPLLVELWRHAAETIDEAMTGLTAPARERLIETLWTIKRNLEAAERDTPDEPAMAEAGDHVA